MPDTAFFGGGGDTGGSPPTGVVVGFSGGRFSSGVGVLSQGASVSASRQKRFDRSPPGPPGIRDDPTNKGGWAKGGPGGLFFSSSIRERQCISLLFSFVFIYLLKICSASVWFSLLHISGALGSLSAVVPALAWACERA